MKKIGLLGCGSIGTQIAIAIDTKKIPATLIQVYDKDIQKAKELVSKLKHKPIIADNPHLLSSNSTEIIVEAASQKAVKDIGLSILQNKKDLVIMSVGALLDDAVFEIFVDACNDYKKKIYLPSGAIAGIDALKSVKDELDSITLTTIKNPKSLKGAKFVELNKINLENIKKSTILFEGSPRKAVEMFPANVNVAAILELSVRCPKSKVCIIADPNVTTNTHKITAYGKFGKLEIKLENIQDPNNPKTSRLASLSAIQLLKEICSNDLKIGT